MNSSSMDIINKETEGLVGRNAFSMAIDATKLVDVVRLYQHYNVILGGDHPKDFFVDGMTMVEMHDHLEVMRSDENKSDHAYQVKIEFFSSSVCRLGNTHILSLLVTPN